MQLTDTNILEHLAEFGTGSVPVELLDGREAFVYLHLPKTQAAGQKVYSVVISLRDASGQRVERVACHTSNVFLEDVTFIVRDGSDQAKSGRRAVLATGVKNVHAGCRGKLIYAEAIHGESAVTYDPKKHETFVHRLTGEPIYFAPFVHMGKTGVEACELAGALSDVHQCIMEKQAV